MKCLMTVAAVAMAAVALAEGPMLRQNNRREGFGGMMGGDPILRLMANPTVAEKVGLGDEQKAKLKELFAAPKADQEAQKKVREGMERQAELLSAEVVDEAAVMAAIDEVFEARKAVAKDQTKRIIAVRSILTKEQLEKVKELAREKRAAGPREGGKGPGEQQGAQRRMRRRNGAPEAPKAE